MELEKASFPLPGQWNGVSPLLCVYPWEGRCPPVPAAGTGSQESLVMDVLRLAGGISTIKIGAEAGVAALCPRLSSTFHDLLPGPVPGNGKCGTPAAALASRAIRSLTAKQLKTGLRANLLCVLCHPKVQRQADCVAKWKRPGVTSRQKCGGVSWSDRVTVAGKKHNFKTPGQDLIC